MKRVIKCPICKKVKHCDIPEDLVEERNLIEHSITAIFVPKNIVCEHRFLIYVDVRFSIRDQAPIDQMHNFEQLENTNLIRLVHSNIL